MAKHKWTKADMANLPESVAVVTGANSRSADSDGTHKHHSGSGGRDADGILIPLLFGLTPLCTVDWLGLLV
jgi:hypothetical protein